MCGILRGITYEGHIFWASDYVEANSTLCILYIKQSKYDVPLTLE